MKNDTSILDESSAWQEKVCIETAEYKISGTVFMPKIGKRKRMLSEILNCNKQFLAVKNCELEYKLKPEKNVEYYNFLQINMSTILLMRPYEE